MLKRIGFGFLGLIFGFAIACTEHRESPVTTSSSASAFAAFVDDYFKADFDNSPTSGTANGLHEYDTLLEDMSAGARQARIQQLKGLQSRLDRLRAGQLSQNDAIDADILSGQIQAELQDLEVLQTWKKNPMPYVALAGGSIDLLMKRDFAPPVERLGSVIARLKKLPSIFQAMKDNVSDPPKEFTDLAIRMAHGSREFFEVSVPRWAKEAAGTNAEILKEFGEANAQVIKNVRDAETWLKKDLLPRSKGSYAIGADAFAKKLLYEERVDIPIDELLRIGEENLQKDYDDFVATAKKINPNESPAKVMKSISDNYPKASQLLASARETVEGIRQFVNDHKIVVIPSGLLPTILETPLYERSGGFASMDSPGPYETKATEAFYYITPVEKDWTAKHQEEHLRLFNRPVMDIITIHEAYPGHYLQFLFSKQFPTKTRKLISCSSNVEGWAHYTEQMMVSEGFGNGDPKVKLAQLQEALLRDCRYVVGIRLHVKGWTVDQGRDYMVEKAFQEQANAFEEARRGAYNPTYLYYTLGKLMIYKFRSDYQKAKGDAFSLEEFHTNFVKQGGIPLKFIRQIMLPGDPGPLL
ncbi:MAG: DUF885 domain-containing protein [Terriglobia bacterium]